MDARAVLSNLSALRLSQGVRLEDIAWRTRIPVYYLEAIENFDLEKLPGGVYRNNFICQYAEAVDAGLAAELRAHLTRSARQAIEKRINAIPVGAWLGAAREWMTRATTALVLCGPASVLAAASGNGPAVVKNQDPRLPLLKRFFQNKGCPAADWAADFLIAADRNGLDWRLLPSIAFLESTGGKYQQLNNPLGWNQAKSGFRSTRHAVHYVANRLARSTTYQNKTLRTKLRIYNPDRSDYPDLVMQIMQQIAPTV